MIELCRRQLNFGDGLIAEEVGDLLEDWMHNVDSVLDDGNTHAPGKIVSLFEPQTEVIRKGKAGKLGRDNHLGQPS